MRALRHLILPVLVLAFLLLMVVFRSLWVPLIAALGFALSVAATFGVTVALWQMGFAGIISDPQPIISFLPIMLIGIVFGLAMDYQVFLVTRIREAYLKRGNVDKLRAVHESTVEGFVRGARVVTAAAIIIIPIVVTFGLVGERQRILVHQLPERAQIDVPLTEQLIVEFYSK